MLNGVRAGGVMSDIGVAVLADDADINDLAAVMTASEFAVPSPLAEPIFFC